MLDRMDPRAVLIIGVLLFPDDTCNETTGFFRKVFLCMIIDLLIVLFPNRYDLGHKLLPLFVIITGNSTTLGLLVIDQLRDGRLFTTDCTMVILWQFYSAELVL